MGDQWVYSDNLTVDIMLAYRALVKYNNIQRIVS